VGFPHTLKRSPHFETHTILERTKTWSWAPKGSETRNDCADEDQQQFAGLDWSYSVMAKAQPSPNEDMGKEAEESPRLAAITRQQLVKI
jgi:hypothetical protein